MVTSHQADIPAQGAMNTGDLGPLAWVLDETRKSIESATKALKRFAHETDVARGVDMASVDASQLRLARQQLHQVVGALEMIGQQVAANMVRGMEAAVQHFVVHPEKCSNESAEKLERGGFALIEYLQSQLGDRPRSALGLFPQYRQVQEMAGADRVHPADLWSFAWRWEDPAMPSAPQRLTYGPEVRARLDQRVLKIMKHADGNAASEISVISLGLAEGESARHPMIFWKLTAGFFEALGKTLLPMDVYAKRVASRILLQYTSLSRGDQGVSERLGLDILFFCAQARVPQGGSAPALSAVRKAWGLSKYQGVPYDEPMFGLYDPSVLAQARRRVDAVKENWSALAGGDLARMKACVDQFSLVTESLIKLHEKGKPLADALTRVAQQTAQSGRPPSAALAMETATAVLFLEASFAEFQPGDAMFTARMNQLAERLDTVRSGGVAPALEPWMEELYRAVSDRQTMGTVIGELRTTLGEVEQHLDQFFRQPEDKAALTTVPGLLAQMRGVLSVLGLDQAALGVGRMRDTVDEWLVTEDLEALRSGGAFERVGNSLGALGFLVDMLGYQPVLARKLFVYDAEHDEFKHVSGRVAATDGLGDHADVDTAEGADPVDLDLELDLHLTASEPASGRLSQPGALMDDTLSPETLPGQLEHIATLAALDDKPALAQAATRAAEAARHQDSAELSDALEALDAVAGRAPVNVEAMAPQRADDADDGDDDLLDIFLEEAREVVHTGQSAIHALASQPSDVEQQTTLRRAFHTLKGSSRMVGLTEFGEAAWSMEQLLNAWLAEQKPVSDDLRSLAGESMQAFSVWVEDIAGKKSDRWRAEPFKTSADALRTEGRRVPLLLAHGGSEIAPAVDAAGAIDVAAQESTTESAYAVDANTSIPAGEVSVVEVSLDDASLAEFDVAPPDAAPTHPPVDAAQGLAKFDLPDLELSPAHDASASGAIESIAILGATPAVARDGDDSQSDPRVIEGAGGDAIAEAEASKPASELDSFEWPSGAAEPVDQVGVSAESSNVADKPAEPALGSDSISANTTATDGTAFDSSAPDLSVELLALDLDELDFAASAEPPPSVVAQGATGESSLSLANHEGSTTSLDEALSLDLGELDFATVDDDAAALLAGQERSGGGNESSAADDEDLYKQIGDLRISTPLYNVYLNEADEWSRQLITELAEWSLEVHQPVPERAAARAHSLAGSSATVGFAALSDLARAIEHALERLHAQPHGTPDQARVLCEAAEDVRRVLHQFAAGILKAPNPAVVAAVHALEPMAGESAAAPLSDTVPSGDHTAAEQAPRMAASDSSPAITPLAAPVEAARISIADDIDVVDAVDPDLFPIFEEEAEELLPQLSGAMRSWAARPDDRDARAQVLRALHTLKGSARLAGALRLGEMAHRTESEIETVGTESVATGDLEAILDHVDELQSAFRQLQSGELAPAAAPSAPDPDSTITVQVDAASAESRAESASPLLVQPASSDAAPVVRGEVAQPAPLSLVSARAAATQAVRVRSQLLDRLVSQAGEVVTSRARLETEINQLRGSLNELTGNLDRLRVQLRDVELQAETQMQSRLALSKDAQQNFDPLEFDRFTRMQELTRMMAESVNDVATVQRSLQRAVEASEDDLAAQARQSRELQRDLLRTRMVEFEGISERLYRVVRQASKETGKQVRLDITGGSIEMDRGILERMTPAFEHLLRNCVVHGIENQAGRLARGKDAVGTIGIDVQQAGNDVSVQFRDDGAGLNLPRIRQRAQEQGLITADQSLTDVEIGNLIFAPGFTTATEVTELAGRGVGMDVVRTEVQALGGRIEIASREGYGSSFRLVLPLTTAVTHVVMIRSGSLVIGVPSNLVEIVRRVSNKELQQAYADGTFAFGEQALPFFWSGALLQSSSHSLEPPARTTPVVVFRSADQRVALHVDEVLGNQEVVVKALGPQLSRLPGLVAITALASGAVALIYNPVALGSVYGEQARALSATRTQTEPSVTPSADVPGTPHRVSPAPVSDIPLVLVVDDSITVRRVTQRLLQREGYRVALAADGLQGLERLQAERPAVVLSDIEMPRMDGFDFVRNIRADQTLADLPVIMITSRIAEKHREHARELGVNHYLGKPYSEEELLGLIKDYARAGAPA